MLRLPPLRPFALLLACACQLGPALAGWDSYGESETGSYYWDRSTLQTDGDRRRVWRLFELKQAGADGVQSGKALIEFSCKDGTYRYLRTLYYADRQGRGRYLGGAKEQPAEPIAPGSTIGVLARSVC
ncbi:MULTISPECIES: surface-adhesin E family protein [Ramlibacter]|uniref:Surface-adhesin protein E-like domain-containing protein n=1 Tax=Ramlibacter pinisoli TaxID=2682844 RepID=A0A6N8ISY1_9BURK|nr:MULTISPECIES: surface-adhesin E family protein [Ramlibacter]MBA2964867.1 hypothetical protein [Ramlibacter sp. CGMCC 1.13660]MVQ29832.1 hypothetical protein [Ramlibacter pinisoli]